MRFLIEQCRNRSIYIILFLLIILIITHTTATILKEKNKIPFKKNPLLFETVQPQVIKKIASKEVMNQEGFHEVLNNLRAYESVEVLATGYTAGKESTGKDSSHPSYGITYSGVSVVRGLYSTIAADLNVFPIGTILYIPGYGFGVVADIGGKIKGNHIDLYYDTVADVYNEWGKKYVKIYVIKKGSGSLSEEELVELNEKKTVETFK